MQDTCMCIGLIYDKLREFQEFRRVHARATFAIISAYRLCALGEIDGGSFHVRPMISRNSAGSSWSTGGAGWQAGARSERRGHDELHEYGLYRRQTMHGWLITVGVLTDRSLHGPSAASQCSTVPSTRSPPPLTRPLLELSGELGTTTVQKVGDQCAKIRGAEGIGNEETENECSGGSKGRGIMPRRWRQL